MRMKILARSKIMMLGILWAQTAPTVSPSQPQVLISFPKYQVPAFPNFSVVEIPNSSLPAIEFDLIGFPAQLSISTVRVYLNDKPLTPFLKIFRKTDGARILVELEQVPVGSTYLQPDVENLLVLLVADKLGRRYTGRISLIPKSSVVQPQLVTQRLQHSNPVVPPPEPPPTSPKIFWASELPDATTQENLMLHVQILDDYGLRYARIELNNRVIETIVVEAGIPTRKRGDFRRASNLPGSVSGSGKHLVVTIPLRLKKNANIIAVYAENIKGLNGFSKKTIIRHEVKK